METKPDHDDDDFDTFLTETEVARRLGVARISLESWRRQGKGPPHIRIHRCVRYSWPQVKAWLAERTIGKAAGQ